MIEIMGKKYFTRKEVAESFDVDPDTVSRWRRTKKLKGHAINKRKFLFSESEIEKFIKRKDND